MSIDKRFWITWLLIVVVCWVDYSFLNETDFHKTLDERVRQSLHIVIYFVVVVIGYIYFNKFKVSWPKYLWLLSYGLGLTIYLIGGVVDVFIMQLTLDTRNHFGTIRLFFSSPLPLIIIYLLHRLSFVNE